MRCVLALPFALLLAPWCMAERYKLTFIPGSKPGEQLELIEHQLETPRKIEQMERFLRSFPDHEAASYVLEWLLSYYVRGNQPDRALEAGERLLAKHPDDFDAMWRCRKAAEQKNDAALLRQWNERALKLAEKVVASPKPDDLDEQAWKQTTEVAKGLLEEEEYNVFLKALDVAAPKERALAIDAFLKRYPKSRYAPQVWPHLMNAYRSAGDMANALAAADKLLHVNPTNLDALLLSGQILLEQRMHYPKVLANGTRVLELVANQPKPEELSPREWEKRKNYYIGAANLMLGNTYVNTNNFVMADKHLRIALPHMRGAERAEVAILFFLGWANYNMEKYAEAAEFFRQCAPFGGQFGEQASRNLTAMQRERRIP